MKQKTFLVKCPECGRQNRVHPEHVRLHRCPYCSEQFFRQAQLEKVKKPTRPTKKKSARSSSSGSS